MTVIIISKNINYYILLYIKINYYIHYYILISIIEYVINYLQEPVLVY